MCRCWFCKHLLEQVHIFGNNEEFEFILAWKPIFWTTWWLWYLYCEFTFCCFELFFYAGCNSVLVLARTRFQKRFFFLLPQCDFSWLNKGWIKINYPGKKRPLWNICCAQLHTNKSWFFLGHWKRFKTQGVMGIWLSRENLYPPRLGKEKSHTFQRELLQNYCQEE